MVSTRTQIAWPFRTVAACVSLAMLPLTFPSVVVAQENATFQARPDAKVNNVRPQPDRELIFHGTADTTVPFENAARFGNLMKKAGNDCQIVPFEGMKHGFFNHGRHGNEPYIETMKQTEQFLVTVHGTGL